MKIIVTGYPKEIQFNVESRLVFGKFLNISIFNYPGVNYPITSVLRKTNSKYDVIPFHSNVNNRYKRMAGLQYFKTNKTHTCNQYAQDRQDIITETILLTKGFPIKYIKGLKSYVSDINPQKSGKKTFLGTTVHDKVSFRHKFVKTLFVKSGLEFDKYYMPVDVPGQKLEQFIFTVKKM